MGEIVHRLQGAVTYVEAYDDDGLAGWTDAGPAILKKISWRPSCRPHQRVYSMKNNFRARAESSCNQKEHDMNLVKKFAAAAVAALSIGGAFASAEAAATSQNAKAERLCEKENGLFVDLGGLAYACVLPTAASENDIRKAQALCGRQGGLFASVGNVVYACVLPGTELPLDIPGTDHLTDGLGGLRILPILLGSGSGITIG